MIVIGLDVHEQSLTAVSISQSPRQAESAANESRGHTRALRRGLSSSTAALLVMGRSMTR
jgi:hypothetical protein